jgi:type I restriction enzyme S subunit
VLLTHKGTVGNTAIAPDCDAPFLMLTPQVTYYRVASDKLDPYFLRCAFDDPWFQGRIASLADQSTRPFVGITAQRDLFVRILPLAVQRRVSYAIRGIDDLIENNRRRIDCLAASASLHWRRLFEGDMSRHCDVSATAARASRSMGQYCKIVMGQAPPSGRCNTDGVGLSFHQGVGSYGRHFPNHETFTDDTRRRASEGDILFSVRAPVGRLNFADRPLVVGRGLAAIRHRTDAQRYLYHFLQFTVREDAHGGGTIFKAVTRDEVEGLPWYEPPPLDLAAFEAIAEPIWDLISTLTRRNATLRKLRDLLLPKLLSGEIDPSRLPLPPEEPA